MEEGEEGQESSGKEACSVAGGGGYHASLSNRQMLVLADEAGFVSQLLKA